MPKPEEVSLNAFKKVFILPNEAMVGFLPDFNVNHFFFEINCFLKDYYPEPQKQSGNIIQHWCKELNINQRMMVVTLNREQGLLNYTDIKDCKNYWKYLIENQKGERRAVNAYTRDGATPPLKQGEVVKEVIEMDLVDWATGCGVPDDGINPKYKGFENQIKGAAYTYRRWYDNFKPEEKITLVNGEVVIPQNAATASLLHYTPHLAAGDLTKAIYHKYFSENGV